MEQEETRAIRTFQWLFMRRFENTHYDFKHELYDLVNDPDERKNLAQLPEYAAVVSDLSGRLDEFFSQYSDPRWDLWKGGVAKSNSTRPFLWKEVWVKHPQGDDGHGAGEKHDAGDDQHTAHDFLDLAQMSAEASQKSHEWTECKGRHDKRDA